MFTREKHRDTIFAAFAFAILNLGFRIRPKYLVGNPQGNFILICCRV